MSEIDTARIEKAVREIIEALGEDPDREGLVDTPQRVGRFYAEVFEGIGNDPGDVLDAFFGDEHYQEIVMVREIPFYSMCEHHLVPFHGQAHVASSMNDQGRNAKQGKYVAHVDLCIHPG